MQMNNREGNEKDDNVGNVAFKLQSTESCEESWSPTAWEDTINKRKKMKNTVICRDTDFDGREQLLDSFCVVKSLASVFSPVIFYQSI